MDYRYCRTEPAVMVEFYLPKRAAFQGPLYTTLTEAIRNPGVVKDHFRDPANEGKIRQFLADDSSLAEYTAADIERLPRLLLGYSMYEVDGTFLSADGQGIAEERSQVLRVFFKYTLPEALRDDADSIYWIKLFFRSPAASVDEFRRLVGGAKKAPLAALESLDEWIRQVWLVVHGFLLFQICDCVSQASRGEAEGRQRDAMTHRQREIWVSSAWTCQVNRAVDAQELA